MKRQNMQSFRKLRVDMICGLDNKFSTMSSRWMAAMFAVLFVPSSCWGFDAGCYTAGRMTNPQMRSLEARLAKLQVPSIVISNTAKLCDLLTIMMHAGRVLNVRALDEIDIGVGPIIDGERRPIYFQAQRDRRMCEQEESDETNC
jgi:hypothetical protein